MHCATALLASAMSKTHFASVLESAQSMTAFDTSAVALPSEKARPAMSCVHLSFVPPQSLTASVTKAVAPEMWETTSRMSWEHADAFPEEEQSLTASAMSAVARMSWSVAPSMSFVQLGDTYEQRHTSIEKGSEKTLDFTYAKSRYDSGSYKGEENRAADHFRARSNCSE